MGTNLTIKKITKSLSYIFLATSILSSASACDQYGLTGFLPENDLNIPVGVKNANTMTEERFNEIIDLADKHYAPIIKARGGKLKWARKWNDGTVNASAQRFFSTYKVNMYGGLARHEHATEDGFALVVCHELGHHLAGAPKVRGNFMMTWASNEGQSDYFATLKCFRRLFETDNNEEIVAKMNVPAIVEKKCQENFTLANDIALCKRSAMAGQSLANLLGSLRSSSTPQFESPDTNVVTKTDDKHPAAQCRLDTYFQGAICDKDISEEVSKKDPLAGTCNRSQGYEDGVRPLCWYAIN